MKKKRIEKRKRKGDNKMKQNPRTTIKETENYLESLKTVLNCGSFFTPDAAKEITMLGFKSKEAAVLQMHLNKDGTPKQITRCNSRNRAQTYLPNGKRMEGVDYEALINKLYDYYSTESCTTVDYSFKETFNKAYAEKKELGNVVEKTLELKQSDYRRFINDELSAKDMQNITIEYLTQYFVKLIKAENLKLSAYEAFKGLISFVFQYAQKNDYPGVNKNPVDFLDHNSMKKLCDTTVNTRTVYDVTHSDYETQQIFEEAERRSKMTQFHGYYIYKYLVRIQFDLGCRPGELVSLKWTDLNTDENNNWIVHIHSFQRDEHNKSFSYQNYTKNEKGVSKGGRYTPISENAKALLLELWELQEKKGILSEFIFVNDKGNWVTTKNYQEFLKSVCDKLGLKSKGTYAFRRGVNNTYANSGMTPKTNSILIGNSANVNFANYTNESREAINQARQALEERNKNWAETSKKQQAQPQFHPLKL